MGQPLLCSEPECRTKNGLLADECRHCGTPISLDGKIRRIVVPGGSPPSGFWETAYIPDVWRSTPQGTCDAPPVSAHAFLSYCALLRSVQESYDLEDALTWFDENIFFLRGGYDFFCHLNHTSNMTLRGRIFGGLNHARGPVARVREWFGRLVHEALARSRDSVDVFVADEIASGSGTHRLLKVLHEAADSVGSSLGSKVHVRFRHFLCTPPDAEFAKAGFIKTLSRLDRRTHTAELVTVEHTFRLFRGPLFGYDAEQFSGLRVQSSGSDETEQYQAVRFSTGPVTIECPTTRRAVHTTCPLDNDFPTFFSVLVLEMLGRIGSDIAFNNIASGIERNGCDECRALLPALRTPSVAWTTEEL